MFSCDNVFLSYFEKNNEKVLVRFINPQKERTGLIVAFDRYSIVLVDATTSKQILIPKHSVLEVEPLTDTGVFRFWEERKSQLDGQEQPAINDHM